LFFCPVAGLFPGSPEWKKQIALFWSKKKVEDLDKWMGEIGAANIRKDQEWFIKTVADFQCTNSSFFKFGT